MWKRLTEHRVALKKCYQKNVIAVQAWKSGHQVEWESAKVKEVAPNPRRQKDCGSSTYPPDTKHEKPGLWLNLRQYLVPSSHMTLPINSFSQTVLCITLYHEYHHYVILILLCHPVPPFPPVVTL